MRAQTLITSVLGLLLLHLSVNAQLPEFWGVTQSGGNGLGNIYKINEDGTGFTSVYNFKTPGGEPYRDNNLIKASNGKYYGLNYHGGDFLAGTIFSYDPITSTYTKIYDFKGNNWLGYKDGIGPDWKLVEASNGLLYGITMEGGLYDLGTLFMIDPSTNSYAKLIDFDGTGRGSHPIGSLMEASDGLLYGVCDAGGTYGFGTLYAFNKSTQVLTKKIDFDNISTGIEPTGELIETGGFLFGLCSPLNISQATNPFGSIFRYNLSTSTLITAHNFSNNTANKFTQLCLASNGKLYGTRFESGGNLIYSLDPSSLAYTVEYTFPAGTTFALSGPIVETGPGIFYGANESYSGTSYLLRFNLNTLQLDTLSALSNTTALATGYQTRNFIIDGNNIVGMTWYGGVKNKGVLYKIDTASFAFTKLMDFLYYNDGKYPQSGLYQLPGGTIVGTTVNGGEFDDGVLFKLDVCNNTYTVLKEFTSGSGLYSPKAEFELAANGKIYSTTHSSNPGNWGIYSVDTATWTYTQEFNSSSAQLQGKYGNGMTKASNGLLYGTCEGGGLYTGGIIFSFDPATGTFQKRYDFNTSGNNGYQPHGKLTLHSNGKLYGTCRYGGSNGKGTLFSFDPATNVFTLLFTFTSSFGSNPDGNLLLASNGKFYGVTMGGGNSGNGVIFSYNVATSAYAKVADFNTTNGEWPVGLQEGSAGVLYGHTFSGGNSLGLGTLFTYNITTNTLTKLRDLQGIDGSTGIGQPIKKSNTTSVTASNPVVCPGSSTTLTASGGTAYTWYPGGLTGSNVTVNPTTPTTYSVDIQMSTGCINHSSITIGVIEATLASSVVTTCGVNYGQLCSGISGLTNTNNYTYLSSNTYGGANTHQRMNTGLVDPAGNVYYHAAYENSITIGTTTLTTSPSTDMNIAIVKKTPSGSIIWVKSGGSGGDDYIAGIETDAQGNLYFWGAGGSIGTFAGYSYNISPAGNFVGKMDTAGNVIWIKALGSGPGLGIQDLKISKFTGDIYVVGNYGGTVANYLTGGPAMTTSSSLNTNGYLGKFNSNGVFQWVKYLISPGNFEGARKLELDKSGNVIFQGEMTGNVVYDGVTTFNMISSTNNYYIMKTDANGNPLWNKVYGDINNVEYVMLGNIVTDCNNNIYVTGSFGGTVAFDSTTATAKGTGRDMMVMKLNPDGKMIWLTSGGAPNVIDYGSYLTMDPTCNYLVMIMQAANGSTFTNTGLTVNHGWASAKPVLVKLDTSGNFLWLNDDFTGQDFTTGSPVTIALDGSKLHFAMYHYGADQVGPYSFPADGGSTHDAFDITMDLAATAGITYSWAPATGLVSTTSPSPYFNGVTNGTYTLTISTGACSVTNTVTVLSVPNVNAGTDKIICDSGSVLLGATSGATQYSWSPATGLNYANISNPLASPTATTQYTVTSTTGSCTSSDSVKVTIAVSPVVNYAQSPTQVCDNAGTFTLTPSTPSGGTYSGTGVTGNTFNPAVSGTGTFPVVYSYTAANTCSDSDTSFITVKPAPIVNYSQSPNTFCADAATFSLSTGSPSGGTYSGTGVSGTTFDPTVSGAGTFPVAYTFTDTNNCSSTAVSPITINALPVINYVQVPSSFCDDAGLQTLSSASPAGGTYTGTGVSGNTFDPSVSGTGTFTIVYSYTNANLCSNSDSAQIIVNVCTGVNEMYNDDLFTAWPNPCSNVIQISFPGYNSRVQSSGIEMLLYNTLGQIVLRKKISSNLTHLDLTELSNGVYIVELMTDTKVQQIKIVKE